MDGMFLESELALLASMANFFKHFEKSTPSPKARSRTASRPSCRAATARPRGRRLRPPSQAGSPG
eukprot:5833638-Prymnesium_polylepis.1